MRVKSPMAQGTFLEKSNPVEQQARLKAYSDMFVANSKEKEMKDKKKEGNK